MKLNEAKSLTNKGLISILQSFLLKIDIADHLHLPPIKLHCSMLAEEAIKGAINDFIKKT